MKRSSLGLAIVFCLAASGGPSSAVLGQAPGPYDEAAESDSRAAERNEILESERWRRANRELDEWLTVQQVYRPEELAAIKQQLRERVAHMSPQELERFLDDMEARLRVLKSPEAEDARMWLKQFMAVARNPEQQLGRSRPDVLNMSAAQIRQEIAWLEQHRARRQQSQAAFDQSRAAQSRIALDAQAARREARQPTSRSDWPANTPRTRSPYSPRRDVLPSAPSPVYMIGPWGAPYFRFQSPPPTVVR
jgi:hypothetical protein